MQNKSRQLLVLEYLFISYSKIQFRGFTFPFISLSLVKIVFRAYFENEINDSMICDILNWHSVGSGDFQQETNSGRNSGRYMIV